MQEETTMINPIRTSVILERDAIEQLEIHAAMMKLSRGGMIRHIIDEYLKAKITPKQQGLIKELQATYKASPSE